MNKKLKKFLIGSSIVAGVSATYYGISELTFTKVFGKKNSVCKEARKTDKLNDKNELDYQWLNNSIIYDVFIKSLDGLRLHGVKVVNNHNSKNWVIIAHGYGHDHHVVLDQARHFDDQGYNILMIDQRAFGLSEGRYSTLGWNEHLDLLQWIDELVKSVPEAKIVLYGVSMGATATMLACGTPIPENVVCAIEDCGFNNLHDMVNAIIKSNLKIKGQPFSYGVGYLIRKRLHFKMKEVDCNRALRNCYVPMMFIHGEKDKFVPFDDVFENYYSCDAEKELFTVPDAIHATSYQHPEYYQKVFTFINKYL